MKVNRLELWIAFWAVLTIAVIRQDRVVWAFSVLLFILWLARSLVEDKDNVR